jgi:HAD superfamily hydrolase (TIGR01509 family)
MTPGRGPGGFAFAAVLFDLDGVVVDSMDQHAQIWQELLAEKGFSIPRRFILENEGALGPGVLGRFLSGQGLKAADSASAADLIAGLLNSQAELYLRRHAPWVKPYPQAVSLLRALRRLKVPVALVTSSRRAVVEKSLAQKVRSFFKAIIAAEDVGHHKPHPEPYLAAASALGKRPGQCLAVENAPAGIQSAAAAGIVCYAVSTTLPPEALAQARAVFPDLDRLAAHLGLDGAAA